MSRENFIKSVEQMQEMMGMWKIVIDEFSFSDFTLGCYYDKNDKLWKVYINNERGRHKIRLATDLEDEALDKLYSLVKYKAESNKSLQ